MSRMTRGRVNGWHMRRKDWDTVLLLCRVYFVVIVVDVAFIFVSLSSSIRIKPVTQIGQSNNGSHSHEYDVRKYVQHTYTTYS